MYILLYNVRDKKIHRAPRTQYRLVRVMPLLSFLPRSPTTSQTLSHSLILCLRSFFPLLNNIVAGLTRTVSTTRQAAIIIQCTTSLLSRLIFTHQINFHLRVYLRIEYRTLETDYTATASKLAIITFRVNPYAPVSDLAGVPQGVNAPRPWW